MPKRIEISIEEHFWSKVDKLSGADACWLWQAYCKKNGYGIFYIDRWPSYAHRVAWGFHYGEIPKGQMVLHRCDNPPCVNPAHLFLGTQVENLLDMRNKGRSAKGDKSSRRKHPKSYGVGETASWSKLKNNEVLEIRKQYERGETQAHLAQQYGVSSRTIGSIVYGKNWKHLDPNNCPPAIRKKRSPGLGLRFLRAKKKKASWLR